MNFLVGALYSVVCLLGIFGVVRGDLFVIAGSIILYLIILGLSNIAKKIKSDRIIISILISMMFLAQLISGIAVSAKVGDWDVGVIDNIARYYVDNGNTDNSYGPGEGGYLLDYKNNIPITLFLSYIFKTADLFGVSRTIFVIFVNNFMIFAASVMTLMVIFRFFGVKASVFASILMILILNISPYSTVFYTDSVGLFFVALVMFFGARFLRKRNFLNLFLLAFSIIFGFLIKPTVLIILIAFCLMYLLSTNFKEVFSARNLKAALIFICCCVFFYGVYFSIFKISKGFARYSEAQIRQRRLSIIHFLGLGSLRGLPPYEKCKTGGYCTEYVDFIRRGEDHRVEDVAKKNKYSFSIFKNSLLTDFPFGYLRFIVGKVERAFSDGSFGVWTEGLNQRTEFIINNGFMKEIQDFLTYKNPHKFNVMKRIWQATWLIILIFMVKIAFVKSNKIIKSLILSVVGMAFYQAIFESRARYIFLFIPVFIILASYSFYLMDKIKERKYEKR